MPSLHIYNDSPDFSDRATSDRSMPARADAVSLQHKRDPHRNHRCALGRHHHVLQDRGGYPWQQGYDLFQPPAHRCRLVEPLCRGGAARTVFVDATGRVIERYSG